MSAPTFEPVPCCVFRNDDGTYGFPVLSSLVSSKKIKGGTYLPAVVISDADHADLLRFRALDALPSQGLENEEQYRQEAELRTHEDLKRQYVATRLIADELALITTMQRSLLASKTDTQQGDT